MRRKVSASQCPDPPNCWQQACRARLGSTIGPGGALYVAESAAGRISRIDPKTGDVTTFAMDCRSNCRRWCGGVCDVAFLGGTAYALVTLVGPDVGGSDVVGIYRIDGPDSFTVIADIGAFSIANPPNTAFRRSNGGAVLYSDLSWRIPGGGWPSQPCAACYTRW